MSSRDSALEVAAGAAAAPLATWKPLEPQPASTHKTKLIVSYRHRLRAVTGCAKERVRAPRTDRRPCPKCSRFSSRAEVDEDEEVAGQVDSLEWFLRRIWVKG